MKKYIAVLLCLLLLLLAACSTDDPESTNNPSVDGASSTTQPTGTALDTEDTTVGQRIQLALTNNSDEDLDTTTFTQDDLRNNYSGTLHYHYRLNNVEILLGNERVPLHTAIRDGRFTGEEFLAWAAADARDGYCTVSSQSKNGLTMFIYSYPQQFDLGVYCDLYETTDGGTYMFNEITVYKSGECEFYHGPFTVIGEDGELWELDLEDWGLTMESTTVSPTGLEFTVTQADGMILGELNISNCFVYNKDNSQTLIRTDGTMDLTTLLSTCCLTSNDETAVSIDWTDVLGSLPSGNYSLLLVIEDIYDEADLDPAVSNYRDVQNYAVDFVIP